MEDLWILKTLPLSSKEAKYCQKTDRIKKKAKLWEGLAQKYPQGGRRNAAKKKKTTVDLNQHIFTHIFVRQTSTNNKIDHVHQKYSQLYRKNTNNK